MAHGSVKWFNTEKGYGFIIPDEGAEDQDGDVFVHVSALQKTGLDSLAEGQRVEFTSVPGRNGKLAAEDIRLLDGDNNPISPDTTAQSEKKTEVAA
jgi:CspA family cold shock protein